jgi:hypothetical protein
MANLSYSEAKNKNVIFFFFFLKKKRVKNITLPVTTTQTRRCVGNRMMYEGQQLEECVTGDWQLQ